MRNTSRALSLKRQYSRTRTMHEHKMLCNALLALTRVLHTLRQRLRAQMRLCGLKPCFCLSQHEIAGAAKTCDPEGLCVCHATVGHASGHPLCAQAGNATTQTCLCLPRSEVRAGGIVEDGMCDVTPLARGNVLHTPT